MADGSLIITIGAKSAEFQAEIDKLKNQTRDLENQLSSIAKISGVAFAALTATVALTVKQFADFESGLIGVGKTTNISGQQLKELGDEIEKISLRVPRTTGELLEIAQAAGQLGVTGKANITKFTETIAKLGAASDLQGEAAATVLTRIVTITGEGVENIDKFASVIVALGNNFAATESEIAKVTIEVARSTSVFGLSSDQAAALATTLKAMGIQAQLGGSAVGRAFRSIDASIRKGGKGFQDLQKITGLTGVQLRKTFKEDAASVFQAFVEGLGKIQEAGGDTTSELAKFGLKGDEILKVLPVLAQRSDILGKALKLAADETENATALNKEAETAFKSLNNQIILGINKFTSITRAIGAEFAPQVTKAVKVLSSLFDQISQHPEIARWAAVLLAGTTIVTGFVFAISAAGLALLKMRTGILGLGVLLPKLSVGLGQAGFAARGFSIAIRGVGFAAKAAIGATGIGLIIVALGDLALNFDVRSKQITKIWSTFLKSLKEQTFAVAGVFAGIITGNIGAAILAFKSAEPVLRATVENLVKDLAKIGEEASAALGAGVSEMELVFNEIKDKIAPIAQDALTQALVLPESVFVAGNERLRAFFEQQREIAAEFAALNDEEKDERIERERLAEEALRAGELESLASFNTAQRKQILKAVSTNSDIRTKAAIDEVNRANKARAQFQDDERKHGKIIAEINSIMHSEVFQGAKSAASDLAALQQSSNSVLKAIGKAAALFQIAIKTQEAAMNIYAGFATIPIIGPALGIAGAAAAIVFGAERASRVLGAQRGGIVPSFAGQSPGGDTVPAFLTPGEFITPKENFEEVTNALTAQRIEDRRAEDGGEDERPPQMVSIELLGDEAERMLTVRQNEASELGISEAI